MRQIVHDGLDVLDPASVDAEPLGQPQRTRLAQPRCDLRIAVWRTIRSRALARNIEQHRDGEAEPRCRRTASPLSSGGRAGSTLVMSSMLLS